MGLPLYEQGEQHNRILMLERQLAELPGGGQTLTELAVPGALVAVRRSPASQIWHRGRLDQLSMYGKQLLATVFLLDYGEVLEKVKVDVCVRHMPERMGKELPMAFQILLSGLQPVSMDLDFMLGQSVMEVTPARNWDQAAWVEVRKEVVVVKGVAELRDWVVDQRGRYQGQLYLVEETGRRIHLNQMLMEKQYAEYSQWQVETDMAMTGDWENECRALDLRGRDRELPSWELLGEENVSGKSLEEFASEAFGESEIKGASIELGVSTWDVLSHVEGLGKGRGMNGNEAALVGVGRVTGDEEGGRLLSGGNVTSRANGAFGRGQGLIQDVREQYHSQGTRADKAKDFLEKLKKRKVGGGGEIDEDIWAALRSKQCQGGQKPDSSSTHLLPGGVFIGKYHENVLANIQSDNKRDQKKKFEQFVAPKKDGK